MPEPNQRPSGPSRGPINLQLPPDYQYVPPETDSERLTRTLREYTYGPPPPPPPPSSMADSEFVEQITRVMMTLDEGATVRCEAGRINVSIHGATAELLSGKGGRLGAEVTTTGSAEVYAEQKTSSGAKVRLSGNLDDPLNFEVTYRDLRFITKVNTERWEMTLSIGQFIPMATELPGIFRQGESSLRSVIGSARDFDIDNVDATKQAIEPHVEPLGKAIRSAKSIYDARTGWNFGVGMSGPMSKDSDTPTSINATLTFRF